MNEEIRKLREQIDNPAGIIVELEKQIVKLKAKRTNYIIESKQYSKKHKLTVVEEGNSHYGKAISYLKFLIILKEARVKLLYDNIQWLKEQKS